MVTCGKWNYLVTFYGERLRKIRGVSKSRCVRPCIRIAESDAFVHCQSRRIFEMILKLKGVYQSPRNHNHVQEHEVS